MSFTPSYNSNNDHHKVDKIASTPLESRDLSLVSCRTPCVTAPFPASNNNNNNNNNSNSFPDDSQHPLAPVSGGAASPLGVHYGEGHASSSGGGSVMEGEEENFFIHSGTQYTSNHNNNNINANNNNNNNDNLVRRKPVVPCHSSVFYPLGMAVQPPVILHYVQIASWRTIAAGWDFFQHRRRANDSEVVGHSVRWLHNAVPRDRMVLVVSPVELWDPAAEDEEDEEEEQATTGDEQTKNECSVAGGSSSLSLSEQTSLSRTQRSSDNNNNNNSIRRMRRRLHKAVRRWWRRQRELLFGTPPAFAYRRGKLVRQPADNGGNDAVEGIMMPTDAATTTAAAAAFTTSNGGSSREGDHEDFLLSSSHTEILGRRAAPLFGTSNNHPDGYRYHHRATSVPSIQLPVPMNVSGGGSCAVSHDHNNNNNNSWVNCSTSSNIIPGGTHPRKGRSASVSKERRDTLEGELCSSGANNTGQRRGRSTSQTALEKDDSHLGRHDNNNNNNNNEYMPRSGGNGALEDSCSTPRKHHERRRQGSSTRPRVNPPLVDTSAPPPLPRHPKKAAAGSTKSNNNNNNNNNNNANNSGVEVIEVRHEDITALDYAPRLTSSRFAIEAKAVYTYTFPTMSDALRYYGCPEALGQIKEQFYAGQTSRIPLSTTAGKQDVDGENSNNNNNNNAVSNKSMSDVSVSSSCRPHGQGADPSTVTPLRSTISRQQQQPSPQQGGLGPHRMDSIADALRNHQSPSSFLLPSCTSLQSPVQPPPPAPPPPTPDAFLLKSPVPHGSLSSLTPTTALALSFPRSPHLHSHAPLLLSAAASPFFSQQRRVAPKLRSAHMDTVVSIFTADPDFAAVLREFLMPDAGTHPYTASLKEQRRMLSLYEAGMPAWTIFLASSGLPYRRLLRLMYVGMVNIWPLISLAVGLYDLYKHLPQLKKFMARTLEPLTSWVEQRVTLRVSMLVTYLASVILTIFYSLTSFLSQFYLVQILTLPFFKLLFAAVQMPVIVAFDTLWTVGSILYSFVSLLIMTVKVLIIGPFLLVSNLAALTQVSAAVPAAVEGTSLTIKWWNAWQEFWVTVASPIKNLAKAWWDSVMHVSVSAARREASIRRWYSPKLAMGFRIVAVARDVVLVNSRMLLDILLVHGWGKLVLHTAVLIYLYWLLLVVPPVMLVAATSAVRAPFNHSLALFAGNNTAAAVVDNPSLVVVADHYGHHDDGSGHAEGVLFLFARHTVATRWVWSLVGNISAVEFAARWWRFRTGGAAAGEQRHAPVSSMIDSVCTAASSSSHCPAAVSASSHTYCRPSRQQGSGADHHHSLEVVVSSSRGAGINDSCSWNNDNGNNYTADSAVGHVARCYDDEEENSTTSAVGWSLPVEDGAYQYLFCMTRWFQVELRAASDEAWRAAMAEMYPAVRITRRFWPDGFYKQVEDMCEIALSSAHAQKKEK